jgi:hypothetical protein
MCGNCIYDTTEDLNPNLGAIAANRFDKWLKCNESLNSTFEADGSRFDTMLHGRLSDHCSN